MKKIFPFSILLPVTIVVFILCPRQVEAQTGTGPWDLLSDLLEQMDNSTNENFFNNFEDLSNTWSVDQGGINESLDGLFEGLQNNPPDGIVLDDNFLDVFGPGADLLNEGLEGFDLSLTDEDTIFGAFNNIQDIFTTNFDSLGGIYGQYEDSLYSDAINWDIKLIGYDGFVDEQTSILQDSFDFNIDQDALGNDPTAIADVIGSLFDRALFPNLEIAFGLQQADFSYWGSDYGAKANVLRVGSVPSFDQNSTIAQQFGGFPIEARWHVQASWIDEEIVSLDGDAASTLFPPVPGVDPNQPVIILADQGNFTPLLFSGDFALMTAPIIGVIGSTSFRLITSLGVEFGTYAPAHADFKPGRTDRNEGFATGYGPQFGAGFSISNGPILVYSIGTVSDGETLRCPAPYKYSSRRFETGIRYADIINVRYSTGVVSWQPNGNRVANVRNQFTVGLIF